MAILLPSLIASYYGQLQLGMTISLGALCISITDAPGPIVHKRNSMLVGLLFLFIVGTVTGFARLNVYLLGLEILLFSFLFSMFHVYGNRAAGVGGASLLILILIMDQPLPPSQVLPHSLLMVAGGVWYLLISLLFHIIQPYRPAQRALGQCIRELARFLSIKADFYNPATPLADDYTRLLAQQVVVSESQDTVRELFFKSRQIVKETTTTSSALLLTFVDTVDMFEEVTATYYDYEAIHKRFADYGILNHISEVVKQMAQELDYIGMAIQSNISYRNPRNFEGDLEQVKQKIDALGAAGINNMVLKKILVNIRRLAQRINDIAQYFKPEAADTPKRNGLEYHRFVSSQSIDLKLLWDNLTFSSSVFRHSLRVAIGCFTGYILIQFLTYGQHSYWILMTIAFILRPAYSLTKKRNVERIIGTVAGGLLGILILAFIPNSNVQFAFMVLFMLGTYTFQRSNYIAMVFCVTPYVLILFKFVGVGFIDVAQERVLDTIIGCAVAFSASHFLFPQWEQAQLKDLMRDVLQANMSYLQIFFEKMTGQPVRQVDYKLVRKNVYVHSANLAAAFQRMLSEPKSKQTNKKEVHQFVVLNHILFSNIAAFTSGSKRTAPYPDEVVRLARRCLLVLCNNLKKLGGECSIPELEYPAHEKHEKTELRGDDALLKDQLEFVLKVATDLEKIIKKITAAGTTQ